MDAYEELQATGVAGDHTIALLRQLAAQYTRTHSFPPPEGYLRWDAGAVDDLLAAIFAVKKSGFLLACLTQASDEASLERLLLTTIGNHLKDEAKGTERGKLRRRLENLLGRDSRFTRVAAGEAGVAGWTVTGGSASVTLSSGDELQRAAWSVRGVSVTRWNTAGPTPAGTRHALLTVAEAVLSAAGGVVRDEDLARAVESRFALLAPPRFTALSTTEPAHQPAADADDEPPGVISVEDVAEDLWRGMPQIERTLLPHLADVGTMTDQELAAIAGTGPNQARVIADQLIQRIRAATMDDEQRDNVVLALYQKCVTRP